MSQPPQPPDPQRPEGPQSPFDAGAAAPGAQQGEPHRSSGIGKGPVFAIIGCDVLVFVLVVGIGGHFVISDFMDPEEGARVEAV